MKQPELEASLTVDEMGFAGSNHSGFYPLLQRTLSEMWLFDCRGMERGS